MIVGEDGPNEIELSTFVLLPKMPKEDSCQPSPEQAG